MLGPYTNLEALLEATKGQFYQLDAGQAFKETDWDAHQQATVAGMFNAQRYEGNPVIYILLKALFDSQEFSPDIYVQGFVPGETPNNIARAFEKPDGPEEMLRHVKDATEDGYPPSFFRFYMIGPSDRFFAELLKTAWGMWEKDRSPNGIRKAIDGVKAEARSMINANKSVFAWTQVNLQKKETPGGTAAVHFSYPVNGRAVHSQVGVADIPAKLTPEQKKLLKQTPVDVSGTLVRLLEAFLVLYHGEVQQYFEMTAVRSNKSIQSQIEKTVKDPRVRTAYMKAKGMGAPKPYKVPDEAYKTTTPHTTPDPIGHKDPVTGEVTRKVSFRRVANKSKVVGSVRSEHGYKQDTVTADPRYRAWLRSDGTISKPKLEKIDQRDNAMMPVDSVAPIIETEHYRVIFGVYYDHYLIAPGLNAQLWWYSDRNLFMNVGYQYGVLFGDRPNLAFIVYQKTGPRAGEQISAYKLKQRSDHEARNVLAQIDQTSTSFWRQVAKGQQIFPVMISKRLGISADKLTVPANPRRETPEGVPTDAWAAYVTWVRKNARMRLGLNLQANLPIEYKDAATGKMMKYDRSQIAKRYALTQVQRHTGDKDKKGKPIEPWAVYIIQYLLVHGMSDNLGSPAYMVPVNVLRSNKGTVKPLRSLRKVDKAMLSKLLHKHWGHIDFMVAKNSKGDPSKMWLNKWEFIRADPRSAFPYARLVRPHAVTDKAAIARINSKLPPKVQRTMTGYVLDGIEYDAYVMLVAMPPSVAHDMSIIERNASARQLISDPTMINRLRRGKRGKIRGTLRQLGLTSKALQMRMTTNPFKREMAHGFDPVARGVIPDKTELPAGYYLSKIGEHWSPQINTVLNNTGNTVARAVESYQHANTYEERKAIWDHWVVALAKDFKEVETSTRVIMNAMARVPAMSGARGEDIADNVDTFLKYVTRTTRSGKEYRVPSLINRVGLKTYHAPFGSVNYRNVVLTIKAPSADVAKILILYRLLRRSQNNKTFGKAMLARSISGKFKIFPDLNARLLAQWAATGFVVVKHDGPHLNRIPEKRILPTKSRAIQRAGHMGAHRFAQMLRVE